MSYSASIQTSITLPGMSAFASATSASDSAYLGIDETLPAAHAGTLTTRSGNTDGVITLTAGHDIVNGNVCVFWTGGFQPDCTAVISDTNTCTISGGDTAKGGAVLPAQTTAVYVAQTVSVDFAVTGTNASLIVAASDARAYCDFQAVEGTPNLCKDLSDGSPYIWNEADSATNPITGVSITHVQCAAGTATAARLRVGVLYDSTP